MKNRYPDDLYRMNVPAWCEVYRSVKYDENLYIFNGNCVESVYEILSAEDILKSFCSEYKINSREIFWEENEKDLLEYLKEISKLGFKSRENTEEYAVSAKLIGFSNGKTVRLPENAELLRDMLAGKIKIDAAYVGRFMVYGSNGENARYFYDKINGRIEKNPVNTDSGFIEIPRLINVDIMAKEFSDGIYTSFEELKNKENSKAYYCSFLRELYMKIISKAWDWCEENGLEFVIKLPLPQIPFAFGGIGFYKSFKPVDTYYSVFENRYFWDGEADNYFNYHYAVKRNSTDHWNGENELIKVPVPATPEKILAECGFSLEIDRSSEGREQMLEEYNIPIYFDTFYRVYGSRTKEETEAIYCCICKYKYLGYKLLCDYGADVFLGSDDKHDINIGRKIIKRSGAKNGYV
ncbi:MAG: hypothetical protein K2K57_02860 [Oscillospiraceae bacterium]|nr:hypothetical protein [Oscillospiraceae bacterium]